MALPLQRTLGDLRGELLGRLGFANMGPPTLLQREIANSFLREAQVEIHYATQEETHKARELWNFTTQPDQKLYDWPTGFLPHDRLEVEVYYQTLWLGLHTPITRGHDSVQDTRDHFPQAWDYDQGQIRIWPTPSENYTIRFVAYAGLARFSQDSDRSTVSDDTLFPLALYKGKLHYHQPDAQEEFRTYGVVREQLMGKQKRGRRWVRVPRTDRIRDRRYWQVPPSPVDEV